MPTLPQDAEGRVLVVEHDPAQSTFVAHALKDAGFDVEIATSHEEALAKTGTGFEVVLVNIRFGGDSGIAFAERIRSVQHDECKVVFIGELPDKETGVEALDSGDALLLAPFSKAVLTTEIQRLTDDLTLEANYGQR
jgi:DNA-binding response OmpR family regulator